MVRIALISLLLLGFTVPSAAQIVDLPPSMPLPLGVSSTAVDRSGNLFVFDLTFTAIPTDIILSLDPFFSTAKTRVTMIANGVVADTQDYDGLVQIVGVGRHAVYALWTPSATVLTLSATSKLLAFRVNALNKLMRPVHSIDVPLFGQLRLAAAEVSSQPDILSMADTIPILIPPVPPRPLPPAPPRYARIIKYHPTTEFPPATAIEIK